LIPRKTATQVEICSTSLLTNHNHLVMVLV
jgi:hypothetical protein